MPKTTRTVSLVTYGGEPFGIFDETITDDQRAAGEIAYLDSIWDSLDVDVVRLPNGEFNAVRLDTDTNYGVVTAEIRDNAIGGFEIVRIEPV